MHRLRAVIPEARLAPYERACAGTPIDPITLYRWASSVALAVFDDLGLVEVAMRSAMARELAARYGLGWFRRGDLLDDETLRLIDHAWRVARLARLTGPDEVVHGKLVASLMFGFWVKLIGRGGYQGEGTARERRIYDTLLWKPALRHAFPSAPELGRSEVESAARNVQALRNRIAHREHIVWGIPIAGETRPDGSIVRLPLLEVHDTLVRLAGFVDKDLEGWLCENSQVQSALKVCPVPALRG